MFQVRAPFPSFPCLLVLLLCLCLLLAFLCCILRASQIFSVSLSSPKSFSFFVVLLAIGLLLSVIFSIVT